CDERRRDGVECCTYHSDSRHQGIYPLLKSPTIPHSRPNWKCQPDPASPRSSHTADRSRLLTRSAARAGHVLRAIPVRGTDTIAMDSTGSTIAIFPQLVNTTRFALRRFARGESVNAS